MINHLLKTILLIIHFFTHLLKNCSSRQYRTCILNEHRKIVAEIGFFLTLACQSRTLIVPYLFLSFQAVSSICYDRSELAF